MNNRTVQELAEISNYIDVGKSDVGILKGNENELAIVASVIVALIRESCTNSVGTQFDDEIKAQIVKKNFEMVTLHDGEKRYEELLKKDAPGVYRVKRTNYGDMFELVDTSGEVLGVSETYSHIDSCMNGIEAVKKHAHASAEDQTINNYQSISNPKYEIYCDKAGQYRFRLKAMNGQVIMVSGGYVNKEDCLLVIKTIQSVAYSNDVEKR